MEIHLEPGTIPSVILRGSLTSADVSSVYVNGSLSSLAVRLSVQETTNFNISLLQMQNPIAANEVVQFAVDNSPSSGDELLVTFVGRPATTAIIDKLETDMVQLSDKLRNLDEDLRSIQRGLGQVSNQVDMLQDG